jgi:predicted dehydrogenase
VNDCSADYTEIIENDSINAILIATRHNLHGKLVLEALRNGKHVYTEKPLCIYKEELEEISILYNDPSFAKNPPFLMLGYNRRFAPFIKQIKKFFHKSTEPMVLSYRVNAGFMDRKLWYQQREIGGGRIIGEVCHFVDTFQYLTEALPISVFAQTIKTNNQKTILEDNVLINIQFSDGSVGSIIYVANGDPKFSKEYLEVFCGNSVAVMDNFSTLVTSRNGVKKERKSIIQDKGHKDEMKWFVEAIKGRQPVPTNFASIYATTLSSMNILESIATGKPVKIDGR